MRMGKAGEALEQIEIDEDEKFTPGQIAKFKADPESYLKFVKGVEEEVNGNFPIVNIDPFPTLNSGLCL